MQGEPFPVQRAPSPSLVVEIYVVIFHVEEVLRKSSAETRLERLCVPVRLSGGTD